MRASRLPSRRFRRFLHANRHKETRRSRWSKKNAAKRTVRGRKTADGRARSRRIFPAKSGSATFPRSALHSLLPPRGQQQQQQQQQQGCFFPLFSLLSPSFFSLDRHPTSAPPRAATTTTTAARLPPAPSPSPRPSSARAETCQGPRPRPHTLALPLPPSSTTTTTTTLTTTTTTTTTGSSHAPSHVPPPRGGALSLRDGRRGQGARSCSRYAFLSLSLSFPLSFSLSLSLSLSWPDFGETVPSIDFIFPTCPNHIPFSSPRLPSSFPLLLAGAQ